MRLLLPLASLLGLELDELTDRLKRNAIAYGAIAALLFGAVIFLLVAVSNWLTLLWGPVVGPLALGLFFLVAALLVYAGIAIAQRAEKRQAAARRHSAERTALVTTAAASALPLLLRSGSLRKFGLPLGGVLAAAFLLTRGGRSPDD